MKITDVQRNLSLHQGTAKRVEAIATELRGAGLLPKGGRGPYAPDATSGEIALLALAVAGVDKVADAVPAAQGLAATVDRDGRRLLDVLGGCVADPVNAHEVLHIRVDATQPRGEVTMRHTGECIRFFEPQLWATPNFVPEAEGQGFAGRIGHIGGAVLAMIAVEFTQGDETGEFIG